MTNKFLWKFSNGETIEVEVDVDVNALAPMIQRARKSRRKKATSANGAMTVRVKSLPAQ